MNKDFNLYVFSDDANFCSALALECNSYGFELTFFELSDLRNGFKKDDKIFSVIIIDLSEKDLDQGLKIGEKIRLKSDLLKTSGFSIYKSFLPKYCNLSSLNFEIT